ncbi:MAG: hypothetical protein J4F41_00170 [Alphaproteobacteria bacterium]|nr:hypothetical protein [Alphaproteobacteria bacterium]
MTTYKKHLAEHRRLSILRAALMNNFKINESITQTVLAEFGLVAPREEIRAEFTWLAEAGLGKTEELSPTLMVFTINQRGKETAKGIKLVDGVAEPGPEMA